jgi:hypothetical protein
MVNKVLLTLAVLAGLLAIPRSAMALAGCTTELGNCYSAAAAIDSFWYRWAAGLDCAECVRIKLVGA